MITPEQMEIMRKKAEQSAAKQRLSSNIRQSIRESSQLLDDLWNDHKCQDEVDKLVHLLMTPGILELFATHEAGHVIYYSRAKCGGFVFESPRIIYTEGKENPFDQQRAAIRIGTYPEDADESWREVTPQAVDVRYD
jgi:hypothetical protein